MWRHTEYDTGKIGQITTAGAIAEFTEGVDPQGITAGPDGALWFTEFAGNKIGRITTEGGITEFTIPYVHSNRWLDAPWDTPP